MRLLLLATLAFLAMKDNGSLLRRQILEDVLGEKVEEYEKFDKSTAIENKRQHRKRIPLWKFLLHLLRRDRKSRYMTWSDENPLEFRIKDTSSVAELWGSVKNKTDMTYEKLGRAMRYYYGKNIIEKVCGKRYSYRFILSRRTKKYLSQFIRIGGMKVKSTNFKSLSRDSVPMDSEVSTSEEEDDDIECSLEQRNIESVEMPPTIGLPCCNLSIKKEEPAESNDFERKYRQENIPLCDTKKNSVCSTPNSSSDSETKVEDIVMKKMSFYNKTELRSEISRAKTENSEQKNEIRVKMSEYNSLASKKNQTNSNEVSMETNSYKQRNYLMKIETNDKKRVIDGNFHYKNEIRTPEYPKQEFLSRNNWCETVRIKLDNEWDLSRSTGSTSSEDFDYDTDKNSSFLQKDLDWRINGSIIHDDEGKTCYHFMEKKHQLKLSRQIDPFMGYDYLRFTDYDRCNTLDLTFHDLFD